MHYEYFSVAETAAVVEETVEVAEAGMTTGIVEVAAMTIVTVATEAEVGTAATPGREGGALETTEVVQAPENEGRRGAGVRQGAGTVLGAAARASPGAGAKQRKCVICDIAHQRHGNPKYFDVKDGLFKFPNFM